MCHAAAAVKARTVRPVPVTQFEIGLVSDDDRLHAAKNGINGAVALCGAGRIVQSVPGRFDSDDVAACPGCVSVADATTG